MNILLNGEPLETNAEHLKELVDSLGYGQNKIAAALNGTFVPFSHYESTSLCEGADIEIVAPMQGG